MRTDGLGAYVTTAWMPSWYIGDPLRTYYPPMTALALTPFVYFFEDPFLAYRVFISIVLVAFAGLAYAFLAARASPWTASLGAALAVLAPYQLRTLFFEGNLPRFLALLALPPIFYFTERLTVPGLRRGPAVLALSLAWAWAILCHSQQAAMFAIGMGLYVVARLFLDPDVPVAWAGRWILGLVGGTLLAAPWWLPAYSGAEMSGVPFLPAVKVEDFVAHISGLLPAFDLHDGTIPLGIGLILLALLSVIARPSPQRAAYLVAGGLTAWLALGSQGVLFNLLPFRQQLLPERFLNFTSFSLAMCASALLPFRREARLGRAVILLGLLTLDAVPGLGIARFRISTAAPAVLQDAMNSDATGGGRGALLTYPEPTSVEVYYSAKAADSVFGWALENTSHHPQLRRVLDAPEWGPAYLQRLFMLWDVRQVAVRGKEANVAAAEAALRTGGFGPAGHAGEYDLFRKTREASPVRVIPDRQVLLVGRQPVPFLATYPFAEESSAQDLHEVSVLDPETYPVLGLTRFEGSLGRLEADQARLSEYVERGGVVVADLTGMEDLFGRTVNLLGVNVLRISFDGDAPLRWSEKGRDLPESIATSIVAPEGWSGAVYEGLDVVLAEVQYAGDWWPVLGYRRIGAGKAWFVGMNLQYYAQLTGESRLLEALRDWTLEGVEVSRSAEWTALPVDSWRAGSRGLTFSVEVGQEPRDVIVSYTYSPRWRVAVDGEPASLAEYEHLIRLHLPAGRHEVALSYQAYGTAWPILGLILGGVGAAGLALGIEIERRRFHPILDKTESAPAAEKVEYAPCANCGFRLAQAGAPTPITYPFQVVHCPICGMRMDDEGYVPGETLDETAKGRALADWLRSHNYDPAIVHQKWGFGTSAFFSEPTSSLSGPNTGPGEETIE